MSVCQTIEEFAEICPKGTLIGLDYGTKTIGVAVSDALRAVATPRETISRRKFRDDASRISDLLGEVGATGLIIGLPLNMNGSEGPACQKARAFARNLSAEIDHAITFWDERLSTVAAERALLEADFSRARRAEMIDNVAAAYILQGALDRLQFLTTKTI